MRQGNIRNEKRAALILINLLDLCFWLIIMSEIKSGCSAHLSLLCFALLLFVITHFLILNAIFVVIYVVLTNTAAFEL